MPNKIGLRLNKVNEAESIIYFAHLKHLGNRILTLDSNYKTKITIIPVQAYYTLDPIPKEDRAMNKYGCPYMLHSYWYKNKIDTTSYIINLFYGNIKFIPLIGKLPKFLYE